jgi:uncharacterized protein YeaO (DUF488 family)
MGALQIKRIYEPVEATDGIRILVDRLWPRGVKKESSHLDKWFHQDVTQIQEFTARYMLELKQNSAVDHLLDIVNKNKTVTLLYAARDEAHNHALVLQQFINAALKK